MNKKYIIGGLVALGILCGLQVTSTQATTCLYGGQGGTGLCSATSGNVGQAIIVSSTLNGTPVYTYGNVSSSGGSGSSTLIYASSGISATASGTNGYIIGNTGVTSFNNATGSVTITSSSLGVTNASINGALGNLFNFVASSTGNVLTITTSTSGGSSTINFLLQLSSYLKAALQSLNGATSSAQTIVATSTGISVQTTAGVSNSTTTIQNTGVTSFTGAGCVTAANSSGSVALAVTCISGNQSITFTLNGDATGTAAGTTAITDTVTVQGLNGKALPANTTGTLQYVGGAWKINLATSSLGVYDASGNLSSYVGSSCGGGQFVTGFSATGTVACATPAGGNGSSTIINGATSTNQTFVGGTNINVTTNAGTPNSTTTIGITGIIGLTNGGTGAGGAANGFANLSPITAKGDIISYNGITVPSRVAVGTNGQVLTASSTASDGLDWETPTTSGGSGTVTTSTAFTSGDIPIINGATSIGNSTLSQPGGGLTDVGGVPILDGGGDYIGPNIFMGTTSTVVVGNFVQGGGVEQFNTTTTVSGAQFCAGGLIDIINTTSSITITLPSTSTIAAASCGSSIWAGTFAQQYMRNDSTNTVYTATNGSNEIQEYSAGTPTSLLPGQEWFITGQFVNSSTVQGATSTGTNLVVHYTQYQTSTPLTVSGNAVQVGGVNVATSTGISGSSCTNCNLTYNGNGGITVAANGTSGGGSVPSSTVKSSWVVAADGTGNYTTIQPALNACGTAGGGTIYIASGTYAQAGTGLTWQGSNCAVYGDTGATKITFTGATTLWATGSSTAEYNHDELHNLIMTADGNTSGVAVDMSNMSHNTYENLVISSVGTAFAIHDTVDITYYNSVSEIDASALGKFGVDGSSSEPWNGNEFSDMFLGCGSTGCVGIRMINAEHNTFSNIYEEPNGAPLAGTIGIQIADKNVGSNPGTFGNIFINNYIEGNAIAINVSSSVSAGQGVDDNMFIGGISDTNATINVPTSTQTLFLGFNNNFVPFTVFPSSTFNGSVTFGQITGTQCLHTVSGVLSGTGSDCGSGGGGVATTTTFSAGYLPVTSSSLAITNSNIFQSTSTNGISIGTSTLKNSSTTFQVVAPSNTLTASSGVAVFIGDASSSRPGCFAMSEYPTGTVWSYFWIVNNAFVGPTSTPCP